MSSRVSIQQIVSKTAPVGAALGDEWLNPTTGILYKRTLIKGVVDWLSLSSGYSGSAGAAGPTGAAGGQGPTGVGYTGSDGAYAARGFTGSEGYIGSSGYTGSASTASGYIGSTGYTGSKGLDGVGGITTVTNYTAVTNIVGTTSTYNLIPGYTNKDYTGAINDTYTTDNGDLYAWKGNTLGWIKVGNIKGAVYTLVAQVYTPGSLFTGYNSLYTASWFPNRSISIVGITARVLTSGTQAVSLNINVDGVTVSTISFTGLGPAYASNTPISIASSTSNVTVIITNTGAYAGDLYVSINYVNVF